MALDMKDALAKAIEQDIVRRYDLRGITKVVSTADRRRLVNIAVKIKEFAKRRAPAVMRAFLDYTMPITGKSFRQITSLYFEWRRWSAEVYPLIKHLFPITKKDEDILSRFFNDWKSLTTDRGFYRSVYRRPSEIGGARIIRTHRHTADFFRVLTVLRHYQQKAEAVKYPLFTLRAYLASQIEALAGFVPTFQIGNIVSEKAMVRFEEWYLYRFYNLELVRKGLRRPSDNNPVSNPDIRTEYERSRVGTNIGDFTFDDEVPIDWMTKSAMSFDDECVDVHTQGGQDDIQLPPQMGDLLR